MESIWVEGKPRYSPIPTEYSIRMDNEIKQIDTKSIWYSIRCTQCGKIKPAYEFYIRKNKKESRSLSIGEIKSRMMKDYFRVEKALFVRRMCRSCYRDNNRERSAINHKRYPKKEKPNPKAYRKCTKCGKSKPETSFRPKSGTKSGLCCHCMQCERLYARSDAVKNRHRIESLARYHKIRDLKKVETKPQIHEKTCCVCGLTKPVREFTRYYMSSDGYRGKCKACHRGWATISADSTRVCHRCGEEKKMAQFYRDASLRGGYKNMCKSCCSFMQILLKAKKELRAIPVKYGFDYNKFLKEN